MSRSDVAELPGAGWRDDNFENVLLDSWEKGMGNKEWGVVS